MTSRTVTIWIVINEAGYYEVAITGIAGVVPFLTAHAAKAAIELALPASVDERVTAGEAGDDGVVDR
jgi:hypothetical protein